MIYAILVLLALFSVIPMEAGLLEDLDDAVKVYATVTNDYRSDVSKVDRTIDILQQRKLRRERERKHERKERDEKSERYVVIDGKTYRVIETDQ